MTTAIQLNLFSPPEPAWENITIEWLFNYLNSEYPEMKFRYEEDIDGSKWIEQSVCKKVRLNFYIDRYDKNCVIPGFAHKIFIGGSSERLFGAYCGQSIGFDSMEELKELLPRRIEIFWENVKDYKQYIKQNKKRTNKNADIQS